MKINELVPGNDNMTFKAIISNVTLGKTNGVNKTNYLNIELQDDTGNIDAKLWKATDKQIASLIQGSVVEVVGDIIKYKNERQMKITKINIIEVSDEEKIEFLPKAPIDKNEMYNFILNTIDEMKDIDYKNITKDIITTYKNDFIVYPAATRNHHDLISGLIYHTYCMLNLALDCLKLYPSLNKDLLVSGVILHDIGKLKELSGTITPSYTLQGNLLGHISIGNMMIHDYGMKHNVNEDKLTLLQHMVLSHHGKNEYGSPVLPQIKEAELLYLIDNIDARMNMFLKAEETINEGETSKRIFALDNRSIYLPYKEKI